jgi:UDP-glucose 4-epimerase
MRAVVTGGAGFVGTNLVSALLARGDSVTLVDDFSSGYVENLLLVPGAKVIEGDIRDEELVTEALGGAQIVFHLAASVGNKRSIDDPRHDSDVNALGTVNVLDAARKAGVEKIVVASSAGIFGELGEVPIREDHSTQPQSPYGVSKLAAEKMSLAYAALYEMDAVCLRYFNIYGPLQRFDAYGNVIPIFVQQLLLGEALTVFGDGEQTRDFLNVADVVQANLLSADTQEASGVFNISGGTSITINALVSLLARLVGVEPEIRFASPRPGDVRDSLGDISRAREVLGYEPSLALEEGLTQYVEWMRQDLGRT